jgi:hypothetical protein
VCDVADLPKELRAAVEAVLVKERVRPSSPVGQEPDQRR